MTDLKYADQVSDALKPIRRWLSAATNSSRFETPAFQDYEDGKVSGMHLRLDFEIEDEALEQNGPVPLIIEQMTNDVADLVENGDSGSDDVLFKNLDGAVKRGTDPLSINFLSAKYFCEYKSKKQSTEYTLYFVLSVQWPEDEPSNYQGLEQ